MAFLCAPGCSSWFSGILGAEVNDAEFLEALLGGMGLLWLLSMPTWGSVWMG
jgi:hypothetical protein